MVFAKIKTALKEKTAESAQYLVALDVGTEFVKALIGKLNGDEIEVVGVGRQHQELSAMHSGAIADIAAVVGNCEKALTQAEQQAGLSPRNSVIGLAGELVKGTTTMVRYKRPEGVKEISYEEMEVIIDKVQDRAYNQAKQTLAWELGSEEVDVKLVNSAVVSLQIDGYKVSNPIGFQGKDVAVQLFTAFAPMIHIGALERTAKELDLDLLAVAAEPFAVARSVIGTDVSSGFSAILIDVGGGTTDIAVVDDGGVEGTKMFGIGGRSFTQAIANQLDLEFYEAERVKLGLDGSGLDDDVRRQAEAVVKRTLDVWLNGVELALSEFDRVDHLPHRVFLCGGGASLRLLVQALKQDNWYSNLPFTKKPTIQHINPDQVIGITDQTGRLKDHTFITAMGLLRVGRDTMDTTSDDPAGLSDRLNRLLRI